MKIFKFISVLFLVFFSSSIVVGQNQNNKDKIINLFLKSQKVYEENTEHQFKMTFKLFTTYKSNVVSESYSGVVVRDNSNFYSKIGTTEYVKLKKKFIKVDNESKLININQKEENFSYRELFNLDKMLNNFDVYDLKSDSEFWICTLTSPAITFIPYGKVIIYISKKDFTLAKQIIYILKSNGYKDKTGKIQKDYPRLEINYSDFKTSNTGFQEKLKLEHFIKIHKNFYTPSGSYLQYKIVD